jgi:hypothetical protein
MQLCVKEPKASAVCNMHVDKLDMNNPDIKTTIACDAAPFDCTTPSVPPVTWSGLAP